MECVLQARADIAKELALMQSIDTDGDGDLLCALATWIHMRVVVRCVVVRMSDCILRCVWVCHCAWSEVVFFSLPSEIITARFLPRFIAS